ncbi:UDP-N-acetylmuramoyl-tripeptide--D-alanyl-D-alanine ligase [Glycocaulis sp.]|uniref:UDP-N-acetylmuramoyl-tripeptide--D-alanyl-D- alanine ligase n=1 Tax=Glycocaulis sp. TaxID=1969725 RepID=UPI0025B96A49|nr:UDP-N-acetylmuramoyl-tripeptide--D-alanyl-D-alanine ligase [Glycocaulis sp.]MCH8522306.1 UDP-N-acetylmuramoyl-tripeptide--D-alanyl-D-alanine ligase [Glycocaulis sp.]
MSGPLWSGWEAARATGGRLVGAEDWTASGVSIDTRTLKPGDLFVALKDQRDGHDFVPAAEKAGAAASIVAREDAGTGPRLVVPDVLEALQRLGVAARERNAALRVGVTGSVGKTSVKEAIAAVFRAAGPAHWSVKSYNNHWGVPLTLARMPKDTERAVFEMGMNHAGEIAALTTQVQPHIALITRIAPAHLENLGSMEAIADAKSEIFAGLAPDGVAVIPADCEFAARLSARVSESQAAFLLEFGRAPHAAVRVLSWEDGPESGSGRFDVMGRLVNVTIPAPGAHQAMNAAAVMAACVAAGIEAGMVADVLAGLTAQAGRGASFEITLEEGGKVRILDDSYNANPVSMASAIATLGRHQPAGKGRRVAVLGEMLEIGETSRERHRELATHLVDAGVSEVIGVGAMMEHMIAALPDSTRSHLVRSPERAVEKLLSGLRAGDVVLIKGSNASGVHKVVASLRNGAATAPVKG